MDLRPDRTTGTTGRTEETGTNEPGKLLFDRARQMRGTLWLIVIDSAAAAGSGVPVAGEDAAGALVVAGRADLIG